MPASGPLVSAVVPVYKTRAFLPECLESLLGQTHRELEVICVDDGCPEESLSILEDYAARDSRVRVISQAHRGVSSARNRGIAEAQGDFLLFVDSDDVLHSGACSTFLRAIEGEKASVVAYSYSRHLGRVWVTDRVLWSAPPLCRPDIAHRLSVAACTKFWRMSAWMDVAHPFPEEIGFGEDQVVHWRLLRSSVRIVHVGGRPYGYRMHPKSTSQEGGNRLLDIIAAHRIVEEEMRQQGCPEDLYRAYRHARLFMFHSVYARLPAGVTGEYLVAVHLLEKDADGVWGRWQEDESWELAAFQRMLKGSRLAAHVVNCLVGIRKTKRCARNLFVP